MAMADQGVLIVHDWDFPLYMRLTCLKRAFWLLLYALLGKRALKLMPRWLALEKYSQALALARLARLLGINPVFAIRDVVSEQFPDVGEKLRSVGMRVIRHWHIKRPRRGLKFTSRGAWEKLVDIDKHYMNYDRHYVLGGYRELPEPGTSVCWHVDHMSYNFNFYLEFLERMKKEGRAIE